MQPATRLTISMASNTTTTVASDGQESHIYDEVRQYLIGGSYPNSASKAEKAIIRKRSKKFKNVDGVLYYRDHDKAGDSEVEERLRQVFCRVL